MSGVEDFHIPIYEYSRETYTPVKTQRHKGAKTKKDLHVHK
jgi:hypothetical protein